MNFRHPLPKAKLLDSRNQAILRLCAGKAVLHLGFVDEGLLDDRLRQESWLHAMLARVAAKVVGIDISEQGVRRAQQVGYADCYVADVERLSSASFPRLDYDIILAADIIEHLDNPGLFLGELHSVTTEKTLVVITTPNALNIKTFFYPLAGVEYVHPDHNLYCSPTTLSTLLEKHGFQVTDMSLYSNVYKPNKSKLGGVGDRIGKFLFRTLDFALRYSLVQLFPHFGEGMLVQARKKPQEVQHSSPPAFAPVTANGTSAQSREKILLVGVLGPFDSGPTRVYETLLKSNFTERFKVRFLDMQFARNVRDFERVRPQKFFLLLWYLLRTIYCLFEESYDAICVPLSTNRNAFLKDSLFMWLAVLFHVPVVVFEHGTNIPRLYERCGGLLRWFMKATLQRANRCIVLADNLRFNFQRFLPPDRIISVYLGIDPIKTNGQPFRLGTENDELTILFLSSLLQSKGLAVLLQSIPRVLQVRSNLRWIIAGGWGRDSEHVRAWVTQFISNKHLEGSVSFVGPVQGKEKERILNASDLFVFPTLVDTAPLVVLEAMRSGLPIVATNVGAIPELVSDGVNGLICQKGDDGDLAEKILYLVERSALRQQMRQNNLERFESYFTTEKFATRMISVFESVFSEARELAGVRRLKQKKADVRI
jgi:glycosyltransferase involved in cell wall biosynthesis